MNRGKQAIIWVLMLTAAAWAGGYDPPKLQNDAPYALIQTLKGEAVGREDWRILIAIEKHKPIALGDVTTVQGQPQGIDTKTIRVHRLKGKIDLYHIEWCDHFAGQGRYRHLDYCLVRADAPDKVLVADRIMLNGRWGGGTHGSGMAKIKYEGDLLTITDTRFAIDTSAEKKPLYHPMPADKGDFFQMHRQERIVRTYRVGKKDAELTSATHAYQIQAGDTLDEICKGLAFEKDWLVEPPETLTRGEWISAKVPLNAAKKRYPGIKPQTLK